MSKRRNGSGERVRYERLENLLDERTTPESVGTASKTQPSLQTVETTFGGEEEKERLREDLCWTGVVGEWLTGI